MKINILVALFTIWSLQANAQGNWTVTLLADMPEPVSNNAIATNGSYVYSYMGIDSTKAYSGIHLKGFRYDIANDVWDTIASVPDNLSRIAGSASEVKGKIYIIGGYHVNSNGSEVSSNKVFIYDPDSNSYTSGADIPIPTDDHVQAVWEDSLIYVISGWSNTGNVLAVQIYNPALDTWSVGSPLPGGMDYEAFGASGVIISNTIFYAGGVNDTWVFSMLPKMRIGVINPNNPTVINWGITDDTLATLYRSGAADLNGSPVWFGGADKPYNYDGIEYGTGLGVEPLNSVTSYTPLLSLFSVDSGAIPPIMDMRGIAQIDSNKFIIAGGIGSGQEVSSKTYLLEYTAPTGFEESEINGLGLSIFPNPTSTHLQVRYSGTETLQSWRITDIAGKVIDKGDEIPSEGFGIHHLRNGLYTLHLKFVEQEQMALFVIGR